MTTVALDDLRRFGRAALATRGVRPADAALVIDVMLEQDLRGHGHHGIVLLALRIRDLDAGRARADARVEVLADLPAFTALDAHGALGPVGAVQAMDACIAKAQTQGAAMASLRDMPHWVIPAFYSMRAAAAGLIGYCTCYTDPSFAPVGGASRVLGNNPLSYAIPADPRPPIVVDFGVSASTGRMRELLADGQPLPDGWAVDARGRPLSDPALAMAEGVFLPIAQHRGYGLGLVHELLAATLNAMPIALESPPGRYGGFFMVARVDTFRPRDQFLRDVNHALDRLTGGPALDPTRPIRYPGERSGQALRRNLASGHVDLGTAAWARVHEVAALTNVAPPEPLA
ncbi:MAG: Ldh family oxidoreductase [Chloroflexi bacterium]|nr:Ldh family oxidoreductase [Chloroflexota bacterium]MCY3958734.1 Ldh family oxidoreductase [Chloroflexota bacterium]